MSIQKKKQCEKCSKTLNTNEFFKLRVPTEDNPEGILSICKKCATAHFNATQPATFLPILKAVDHPWLPIEYKTILEKYAKQPNDPAILGRYIGKMKLSQYSSFSFADSYAAQQAMNSPEDMLDDPTQYQLGQVGKPASGQKDISLPYAVDSAQMLVAHKEMKTEQDKVLGELTTEERKYLLLKWGTGYQEEKLIRLERMYQEMMSAYDIRTPSHKDYLRKMCSVSMEIDECIQARDYTSAKALMDAYDKIMKAATFQPAQTKAAAEGYVNSIGELVKLCEREGFIPKYDVEVSPDIVDKTIKDLKLYVKRLFENDDSIAQRYDKSVQELEMIESQEDETLDDDDEIFDVYKEIGDSYDG